ncbi:MAG TPA: NAD(P)H-dependent oxidoreductase subunit E [Bacteroidetes bacterium]|nr:NAD(P)H-dependent oxidoreductase subunit E [Bacteroidota bacterium]
MAIEFSEEAQKEYEEICKHYPDKDATLLPALHLAKREFKTATPEVMEYIASLVGVDPIKVLNVASFYTWYPKEKEGKYVIQVCSTLSCSLMGAETVVDYIEKKLDIKAGETTADGKFTLKKVECLGSCGTAPVMQINDDYFESLTEGKVDQILDDLK